MHVGAHCHQYIATHGLKHKASRPGGFDAPLAHPNAVLLAAQSRANTPSLGPLLWCFICAALLCWAHCSMITLLCAHSGAPWPGRWCARALGCKSRAGAPH